MVGITMITNCASLDADLCLFCYEKNFMLSLSDNNHAGVIEVFNLISSYLDDSLHFVIWILRPIVSMIELIDFMMQQF